MTPVPVRFRGTRPCVQASKPDIFEVEDISPPSTSLGLHRLPRVRHQRATCLILTLPRKRLLEVLSCVVCCSSDCGFLGFVCRIPPTEMRLP